MIAQQVTLTYLGSVLYYAQSNRKEELSLKKIIPRLLQMTAGLIVFALGLALAIKANIGYSPWEILHHGISKTTGITIGQAGIILGVFLVIFVTLAGEKLGLATVFNIILIGTFTDLFLKLLPLSPDWIVGVAMLLGGLFAVSFGTFLYVGSGFGVGPRDNLMILLRRKTKLPAGICRSAVELIVTIIGWRLGGMVGFGTILAVIAIGFCIQITFRACKFDVTAVKHETLRETLASLKAPRR